MSDIDVVLHGGTVWTGVANDGGDVLRSSAVAVSGSRIVAVGDEAEALASGAVSRVDLEGGTLLPGFGDGHAHPVFGGIETLYAPVRGHARLDDLVESVHRFAEANPDADWIRGEGYDSALAPSGEFDARWLDAVVPDRPVVLRAMDYHTAWVNTRALELAGISSDTVDPIDGVIGRREDGTPNGTLREWGAWRAVYDLLPALSDADRTAAVAAASNALTSTGITWAQDAWVEEDTLQTWLIGTAAGVLDARINLALLGEPGGRWRDALPTMVEQRQRVEAAGTELLTAGTVKFFADGILEGGTAAVLEPYCDCPHPSYGLPNWEAGELAEAVTAVVGAGFQPHIHAIGDAGVRMALDAIAAALAAHGTAHRPVIAHCQLIDPADLGRFRELGVVANFEPLWAQLDPTQTVLTVPRIGTERADRQYQLATLLRQGTALSFGSDWPVSSQAPLEGIAVAISRQTADGVPDGGWVPHERLTLDEALACYTAGVAHQAGESDSWGRIVPGMRADLVWVDGELSSMSASAVRSAQVRQTWIAGRSVFAAG